MIKYKYKKVAGHEQKKFTENGHTMFEEDVLQRLERLAYLEEQIYKKLLIPIDSAVKQSEEPCRHEWVRNQSHPIIGAMICKKCYNELS